MVLEELEVLGVSEVLEGEPRHSIPPLVPTIGTLSWRGILSLSTPPSSLIAVDLLVFMSCKNKEKRLREDTLYDNSKG